MADINGKIDLDTSSLENEKAFAIKNSDWTNLRDRVFGLKNQKKEISNWASAFFGIGGSSIISLIPMVANNTNHIYLSIQGTATFFIIILGFIFLHNGDKDSKNKNKDISNVLNCMDKIHNIKTTK